MATFLNERVGYDCTFELDKFQQPRLCSEAETIKNTLMFILFSKPGQYPSIPSLGMNIRNMLYSYYDEIDEQRLEEQLAYQCNALSEYFREGNIVIRKLIYRNMPSLIINVKTDGADAFASNYSNSSKQERSLEFYIGLSVNEIQELLYNITQRYVESY